MLPRRLELRVQSLASLAACFALSLSASCYSPDLTHEVYKCDRGKCPDGLYCNDNVYCTQQVPECAVAGIEMSSGTAICIGMSSGQDMGMSSICAGNATTANCDMSQIKTSLCTNIMNCAFCCTK